MTLTTIESTLKNNQLDLAKNLLGDEWHRSAGNHEQIYYQVIRDKLVATFQLLESSNLCSEWDSFRYCSNALLELDVKNVLITGEMQLRVMLKLSAYGLRRLCGDPIKSERSCGSWEKSTDLVIQWVKDLRVKKWYDFLDVDDEVMFRIRMIHNYLFFIKNQPAMKELPLKEIIFCLAIFVGRYDEIQGCEMYKIVINKRNVMQFLIAIASRLEAIRKPPNRRPELCYHRHSNVLKRLRKAYRRVKQIGSVSKIITFSQIYEELDASDYKRCNSSLTVAAIKRFNQICGEAIKNTADTPNLSTKLSNLLKNLLTDSIMLNSKYRNFSSHGYPLSHLFIRDADQIFYYHKLNPFIYMTAVSFYAIFVYMLYDCTRYTLGLMRRCRTIDDLRALIRYMESSKFRALHRSLFEKIEHYMTTMKDRLSKMDKESFTLAQQKDHQNLCNNYDQKMEIIKNLRDLHFNNPMDTIGVVAFSNTTISAMYSLLNDKLAEESSVSCFETLFTDWESLIMRSFHNTESKANGSHSYILEYMELGHDSTEQWRYRLRTQEILKHFTSDIDIDESTLTILEENLHTALSKGNYQNIFSLDSKSQAIIQTLKASLVGPKPPKDNKSKNKNNDNKSNYNSSNNNNNNNRNRNNNKNDNNDYKKNNEGFKSKLEALRRQDDQELRQVMPKLTQNLRETFKRFDCETIDKFIDNHLNIPIKARLAIEFWQLRIMEILYYSGYLGDNFCLLTTSIPMIWGKSYRNYLAHDVVSYNLLTSSNSIKTLINGFVLAFNSTELEKNIFTRPVKFTLDGLVDLKEKGFRWLKTQAGLLQSIESCDENTFESFLEQKAEPKGLYMQAPGKLLCLMYYSIPEIIAHKQFDQNRIEIVVSLLSPHFQNIKVTLTTSYLTDAVRLNLLQINNLSLSEMKLHAAIEQIEILQPFLMTPIVGAVLLHLLSINNIKLLETLLDRYVGSDIATITLLTTGYSETERDFLETHLGQRTSIIGEFTNEDLSTILTKDYPASMYDLEKVIRRNDMCLFSHIVHYCYPTADSVIDESNMLEAIEYCCFHGRLEMICCLLAIGLKCEEQSMSKCVFLAIINHYWKIVDLLLDVGASLWHEDGVNMRCVISNKNFKMVRKNLKDEIFDQTDVHAKIFINWATRFGSERLLKYLVDKGVNIWKCEGILQSAVMNEDVNVLKFLESKIFEPVENASTYAECQRWIKMLKNLGTLMLISLEKDFIPTIIEKASTESAERWIDGIANLLKIDDGHFVSFYFEDSRKLFHPEFFENDFQVDEGQFKRTLQKCTTLVDLIKSLPPWLFVDRKTVYIEFCLPYETIKAEVDLAIHSTIGLTQSIDDRATIVIQDEDVGNTADEISMGLRTFLLKYQPLKAATATVSMLPDRHRFQYIQIDSKSCIFDLLPWETLNISYLLNKPGQACALHHLQPSSSPHLVKSLLRHGADPTLQNDSFGTPFRLLLAKRCPLEHIKLMYQHYKQSDNFNPEMHVFNIKEFYGKTPLHAAIGTNNYEATEFLLQNGANPKLADHIGEAGVLDYAILNRNVRIVELLLRHSPDLVQQFSDTLRRSIALEIAVKINHDHIVRLLLKSGADLNHRNGQHFTALKYAIEEESVESLQVMLDYAHREGVIVDGDVDGSGTTALQFARQLEACEEIMHLLVCHSIKSVAISLMTINVSFSM